MNSRDISHHLILILWFITVKRLLKVTLNYCNNDDSFAQLLWENQKALEYLQRFLGFAIFNAYDLKATQALFKLPIS